MRTMPFAILLSACTTVSTARRPATPEAAGEINRLLGDGELTVVTKGHDHPATAVEVGVVTTSWTDPATRQRRAVPAAALTEIDFPRRHGLGAAEGAGIGALAGALTGMVIGIASGDDKCPAGELCLFRLTAGEKAGLGAAFFGAVGLVLGAVSGAIIGHGTEIQFE